METLDIINKPNVAVYCPKRWMTKILFRYLADNNFTWISGGGYDDRTVWTGCFDVYNGTWSSGKYIPKYTNIHFLDIIKYLPEKYKQMVVELS
jgi:hypothetical protein